MRFASPGLRAPRLFVSVVSVLAVLMSLALSSVVPGVAAPPPQYHPLVPTRILDTRPGTGNMGGTTMGTAGTFDLQVTGAAGIPATATAVAINITVANTSSPGYLTLWPAGQTRPTASNLNWSSGQAVANLVIVGIGTGGKVSLFNFQGSTDVIGDVEGYVDNTAGAVYTPKVPQRALDTRGPTNVNTSTPNSGSCYVSDPSNTTKVCSTLAGNSSIDVQIAGAGGVVPGGAVAVAFNLTATP
jgi:hypothetical protein